MLLALCVGQMRGTVDDATVERIVRELKNMPLYIKDVLGLADKIKNLSKIYTYARNFLYLGRGYNYPTALEGALKLKEISYIHAEGYPAAEMKHGPIALVDSEMPTVVIAPTDSLYDKIISNVRQVKARGGKERIFDDMNNGFGWSRLPKSFMAENTVFLLLTALIHNFYKTIMSRLDTKAFGLKKTSRIKAFVFRFISVPAKWIMTARQYVLNIYTENRAYAKPFKTEFG